MNRISAIALLAVAGFTATYRASAQSLVTRATVPFAFTVKGITLPAGTYIVNSLAPDLMQIQSVDTKHPNAVTILTGEGSKWNPDAATELIFEAYGSQYFLHEIVCPMRTIDAKVPISQEEKKVASEWASRGGDQPVLVALK